MYIIFRERWRLSSKNRSSSYRLGLRPGSVRLRSRALDLCFLRAFVAGLVSRPPPGLSPCVRSRGRAPPPSTATLNCARFAGSCETAIHRKLKFLLFLFASLMRTSWCCEQASIYLFDLSVLQSITALPRQRPCAGRLRRLRPSMPCLFRYPRSRWRAVLRGSDWTLQEFDG